MDKPAHAHIAGIFRRDQNPAAPVYESIGTDFFLAPAPGWLNLGLWEGSGSEHEADTACRRLVQTVAASLPEAGVILDVGNGLGTQDPVIVEVLRPRRLVAVNITEWQLSAGRDRLCEAAAPGVAGDATRPPIADESIDGVIRGPEAARQSYALRACHVRGAFAPFACMRAPLSLQPGLSSWELDRSR